MPVKSRSRARSERGQVAVLFGLMIPMLLGMSAFVIGIGNWYVHGKHLQTKADAGALAGGGEWAFPCEADVDARIEAKARAYSGVTNPQVGHVPDARVHSVINGSAWYDDDSNPTPVEHNSPNNPSVCASNVLDVKVTEDNSFPLASLIPLFPDIKRRARVEIQQIESTGGDQLIPIAVRSPVPVSAAVFYNETNGNVLAVRYFVKKDVIPGLPGSLQGWTTQNTPDPNYWAQFTPNSPRIGVAIAISLRGACNTALPPTAAASPIVTSGAPCFEDQDPSRQIGVNFPIANLCNQGSAIQIVNCYFATGNWPSQAVPAGLQFIRGYVNQTPLTGPPAIESAHLVSVSCSVGGTSSPAYFSPNPNTACQAQLSLSVDIGTLGGDYTAPFDGQPDAPLRPGDVQVRYRLVRGDGSSSCNYGNQCDLTSGSAGTTKTYLTQGTSSSPHLPLIGSSRQNAVAIEIMVRNAVNSPNPACRGNNFGANCRWFYTGNGVFGTSVAPTDAQILADPIQRSFMGNSVISGSVRWLRITADKDCNTFSDAQDLDAASVQTGGCRGFYMDMGLKGGIALDADEPPVVFLDGTGTSQTGSVDCDPSYSGQGTDILQGTLHGCAPPGGYAPHPFSWSSPICPPSNSLFSQATWPPGGDPANPWPPLRCIKTRTTGTPNQFERAMDERFFGSFHAGCPQDAAGFVPGRNYWDQSNNPLNAANPDPTQRYGYKDDGPPAHGTNLNPNDPRIVTIFLTTTDAFTGPGQNTYPITGFVQVYITGYGQIRGNGSLTSDDPCQGSTLPPSEDYECSGSDCGYVVWGHFLKYTLTQPNATPNGELCNQSSSELDPCVATLVE